MQYYNYEQKEKMQGSEEYKKLDAILQKNFPDNYKWGACVYFETDGSIGFIEICKLTNATINGATWTHYCHIGRFDDVWELYSQFNGEKENELWVFGYYKNFGDACRRVKLGIEKLKPIKKY